MSNDKIKLNANQVVAFLQKSPQEFTKADIMRFVQENDIQMVNFMYPGGDGKLKTLNFVITDLAYLDTILTCGERVDGSSLFSFIEAGSSDLYVLPRFSTAFVDPFAEIPTLDDALLLLRQGRTATGERRPSTPCTRLLRPSDR